MNYLDRHFFRRAAYPRAILETGLLSLLLAGLFLLTRKPDSINLPSLALGLGLASPTWLALRTALPAGSRMKQIAAEGLRSTARPSCRRWYPTRCILRNLGNLNVFPKMG